MTEFLESKSDPKPNRPQFAAVLAQARHASVVLKLAKEAQKNGLGGVVGCHWLDRNATTGGGRLLRCFGLSGQLLGRERVWVAAT